MRAEIHFVNVNVPANKILNSFTKRELLLSTKMESYQLIYKRFVLQHADKLGTNAGNSAPLLAPGSAQLTKISRGVAVGRFNRTPW